MLQQSSASFDLVEARARVAAGHLSAAEALRDSLEIARSPSCRHVFLGLFAKTAAIEAETVDALRDAGAPVPQLGGLAVSIKALFDVQGQRTTSASKLLQYAEVAAADCPAVHRLRRAGAALIGQTNQSEFAFSGVGINPHHGTPANPAGAADAAPLIPGGSTSGGAVSVATGAAWAALGSDTGGSLRIPAALQGLVGFKNTARLTPAEGSIPLSPSLDTVGAITRSVRDAVLLHSILAQREVDLAPLPLHAMRIGVPRNLMLEALEPAVATAFARSLATLRRGGAQIEMVDIAELDEIAHINAAGGFAPVEAWAWHRKHLPDHQADYDPRVAARIRRGEQMSGADYIDLLQTRRDWIARIARPLRGYDVMLSPTVPIVAPAMAPLIEDDNAFFATNAKLLRNPSVVNLLDGCALSLPCHLDGELPVGLMIWQHEMADDQVLAASLTIESALAAERHDGAAR